MGTGMVSRQPSFRHRPHVALLVETSLASGRDILSGIGRFVRETEPWALYHEPRGLEESAPRWLRRWRGDGIIARIQTVQMAKAIRASGIPTVDVLGVVPKFGFPLVHVDNAAIARVAAQHLLDRGLKRFAYFGIEGENWSDQRYLAYRAAVKQTAQDVALYELPRDTAGRRSWERDENRLALWLQALPKPVGLLVCSDQRGPLLLEACRRANLSVPDQIAVVGVDNDEAICAVCAPPLSSVRANHEMVGYQAAALLQHLLAGETSNSAVLIVPNDVVSRLSSDMMALDDSAIAAALRLIRDRAAHGLGVDQVARHVGLSRSVLQRRFMRARHCTVHQDILRVKIQRARELLVDTALPLAVIAERTGFIHQEYMGAVFRRQVGQTPGELRALRDKGSTQERTARNRIAIASL